MERKLKIGTIHPDLGIGGAERLIVDAAVELASLGHNVHVLTAHHDKNRCLEETVAGGFFTVIFRICCWLNIQLFSGGYIGNPLIS